MASPSEACASDGGLEEIPQSGLQCAVLCILSILPDQFIGLLSMLLLQVLHLCSPFKLGRLTFHAHAHAAEVMNNIWLNDGPMLSRGLGWALYGFRPYDIRWYPRKGWTCRTHVAFWAQLAGAANALKLGDLPLGLSLSSWCCHDHL